MKLIYYIIIILLLLLITLHFCDKPKDINTKQTINVDSIKGVIRHEFDEKESILKLVTNNVSVRVKEVIRWKYLKAEVKTAPCDSILPQIVNVCDSIIVTDSTEISNLKHLNVVNDSIIGNYQKLVKNDSTQIISLKKEVKKQKRLKVIFAATAILFGGVAIFR